VPIKTAKIKIDKQEEVVNDKPEDKKITSIIISNHYSFIKIIKDMLKDMSVIFKYICYIVFAYGLYSILQDVNII